MNRFLNWLLLVVLLIDFVLSMVINNAPSAIGWLVAAFLQAKNCDINNDENI